ncbi:tripartite tricarboxylate transporter substrate binding protein [Siccirubricoccus sp. G192]|uniref:Bug family tripartite tricarboxylate transporter substrate binding protein n=1 Tax=Siccirubricoccus sp. G192 TaxID=2849651 RepID=UPI001C2B7D4C|nr:tripartite tricarboxylate transporter substrate binding protein [Siccirubricoccus sp. G192]MBV1796761.1 tripartite tricarboxylate transporter substrate binding protein [Siccirubricoccus sp. G192]
MHRRSLLATLATLPIAPAALAQNWAPERPVRLVVPYSAGGSTDVTARLVAQALGERLGQPVVIENRPGAGGNIAAEHVAHSAPDGYTLLIATSSVIATNQALYRNLPFDAVRDFAPITQIAFVPNLLVVHPDVPARSLAELIALAKSRPGQLNYGSAGSGTSQHLAGALFAAQAGVQVVHVPYRGGAPAVTDLIAGKIQMIMSPLVEVIAHVQAGRLRPLGVTTRRRSPLLPEVPTIAEAMPGFEITLWNGLLAPAGTPPAIVARLATEAAGVLRTPEMQRKLAEQGSEPVGSTPEEFAAFIRTEIPKWTEIVRISGATAD